MIGCFLQKKGLYIVLKAKQETFSDTRWQQTHQKYPLILKMCQGKNSETMELLPGKSTDNPSLQSLPYSPAVWKLKMFH